MALEFPHIKSTYERAPADRHSISLTKLPIRTIWSIIFINM